MGGLLQSGDGSFGGVSIEVYLMADEGNGGGNVELAWRYSSQGL